MSAPPAPPPGLVLGIETATVVCGLALVSPSGVLDGEIVLRSQESHAERLLPALDWLLATLGRSLQDLAAVAVSSGPGSFTGLRAGIATAKGLAFSLGVPLFGIPTLEALAANAPPDAGPACAVINARRGEFYHALFRSGRDGLMRLGPDSLSPAAALADGLPEGCLVLGDIAALQPCLSQGSRSLRFAPPHLNHPRAAATALLGGGALSGNRPSEISSLMPRYLRPSDAEAARPSAGQFICTDEGLRRAPAR